MMNYHHYHYHYHYHHCYRFGKGITLNMISWHFVWTPNSNIWSHSCRPHSCWFTHDGSSLYIQISFGHSMILHKDVPCMECRSRWRTCQQKQNLHKENTRSKDENLFEERDRDKLFLRPKSAMSHIQLSGPWNLKRLHISPIRTAGVSIAFPEH